MKENDKPDATYTQFAIIVTAVNIRSFKDFLFNLCNNKDYGLQEYFPYTKKKKIFKTVQNKSKKTSGLVSHLGEEQV